MIRSDNSRTRRNGFWGVLSLGLFADGSYGDGWNGVAGTVKGLFYGDATQFFAELIEAYMLCICIYRDVRVL
jgi:Amt family ammonium transporter